MIMMNGEWTALDGLGWNHLGPAAGPIDTEGTKNEKMKYRKTQFHVVVSSDIRIPGFCPGLCCPVLLK